MALSINLELIVATIANGQSLSTGVPLGAKSLVGIAMPAAWDAAGLTFQVSVDDRATWLDLVDTSGTALAATVAAAQFVQIDPTKWKGINNVKVRSGTAGAPVNQTADRAIILIVRPD